MRLLKIVGGSVSLLYIVCAIFAVMTFPVSADADISAEPVQVVQEVIKAKAEPMQEQSPVAVAADAIPDWLEILGAVIGLASAVAAITPTPKDNAVLVVVRKVVDIFALNFGGARNASADKNKSGW